MYRASYGVSTFTVLLRVTVHAKHGGEIQPPQSTAQKPRAARHGAQARAPQSTAHKAAPQSAKPKLKPNRKE